MCWCRLGCCLICWFLIVIVGLLGVCVLRWLVVLFLCRVLRLLLLLRLRVFGGCGLFWWRVWRSFVGLVL